MSEWSVEQLRQVENLWVKAQLDEGLYQRHGITPARDRLASAFIQMAHSYAVEVHSDDIQYSVGDLELQQNTREVRGYWSPSTREVELSGGHADGMILTVRDVQQVLNVPGPIEAPLFTRDTAPTLGSIADIIHYRLSRWNETDRRWIFEPVAAQGVSDRG